MALDGFVALGTHLTPEEAGLARGILEDQGIETLLEDEALSSVDPLVRLAIGGTKLLVLEGDVPRALELLGEAGAPGFPHDPSASPPETPEVPESEWSAAPEEPPAEDDGAQPGAGARVVVIGIILALAAVALLALTRRPILDP